MSISAILGTAVQGMQAQSVKVAATANTIANSDTPGYRPLLTVFSSGAGGGVSASVSVSSSADVDVTGEMLGLIEAREAFEANASVFETGASVWDMLLSIQR